jgi:hypothetical protein
MKGEKKMTIPTATAHRELQSRVLSALFSSCLCDCNPEKERGEGCLVLLAAYFLLRKIMMTMPTATIAMMMPIPKPVTYVSVIPAGSGVGGGVACGAGSTTKLVSENDGQ